MTGGVRRQLAAVVDLHPEGDADSRSVRLHSGRPVGRAEPELLAQGGVVSF